MSKINYKCRPMSDCPTRAFAMYQFDLSSYGALQPITFHIGGIYGTPPLSLLTFLIPDEGNRNSCEKKTRILKFICKKESNRYSPKL